MEKRIIKSFEDLECWKAARVHFVNVKVNVNAPKARGLGLR